jgi:diguanylate cyclase (GGDEF)-like protein
MDTTGVKNDGVVETTTPALAAPIFERNSDRRHRLDELITQIAVKLMSATPDTRGDILTWIVRTLAEFLESDVALLRRNDFERDLTVLVTEWPPRDYDGEGPDPLGEVPFDSDPIWSVMKEQAGPYFMGTEQTSDEYLETVESGTGIPEVMGASVPLLLDNKTWGILGFIHFTPHVWTADEIHALEATASMIVQLTARLDAEIQTTYNANHDHLTGLANRRSLIDELNRRLALTATTRANALLMFDVDRFKVVNDYLGHNIGDELLCVIADRMKSAARENDLAARLGGDEFVMLLHNIADEESALAIAQRIRQIIAEPVLLNGQMVSHTASIGVALSSAEAPVGALDLLGRADVAMYASKDRGRNQVTIYDDELHNSVTERSHIELGLAEAIDNDGLRLYYQPEVNLDTGALLAVEALVRWDHPVRGIVNAADFISVAEETGLITRIGRWVFEHACEQLSIWDRDFPGNTLVMRVNMSPIDFRSPDLLDFIRKCLDTYSVAPSRICIEITEHAVLDDSTNVSEVLDKLRAVGLEVAIDDFGTGFASMTELKNIPTDFLKLDMSFVRGITSSRYDRAIVSAIITLAAALDLQVIGEGVEDAAIAAELLDLGCLRAQGYLISRPVPASGMHELIEAGGVPKELLSVALA